MLLYTIVFYKRQGKTDNLRIVGQRITTQHLASDSLKIWGRYGGKCSFYSLQSVCSVTRNSFYSEPPLSKMNPLTKKGVHLYHNSGHLPNSPSHNIVVGAISFSAYTDRLAAACAWLRLFVRLCRVLCAVCCALCRLLLF